MALTPRATDYSAGYNELVEQAQLAQHSAVRGYMVIRPYGYAIWETMQKILDNAFKKTGHQNAYFPLFIPKSFFTKEAKHVEHFATEAAIVTHYRMKAVEQALTPTQSWDEKRKTYEMTADGHICSARGVIRNEKGQILFLYDKRRDVFALPGGKVDGGENHKIALEREIYEELGITTTHATLLGSIKTIWSSGGSYYDIQYTGTPHIKEPEKFASLHRVDVACENCIPKIYVDGQNIQEKYSDGRWMRHCWDTCVLANPLGLAQTGSIANYNYSALGTIVDNDYYACIFDGQSGQYWCIPVDSCVHFSDPYIFLTQTGKELKEGLMKMYGTDSPKHNKEIIVDPDAKLEEELIVRPTSETIIWHTFKNWITSYRDLPLLINQRANVARREMRTRYFLRTAEFLRQEGHTAHASADDAIQEAQRMRHVYNEFLTKVLALDGVMGTKTENEKFAGGETTYTIECMMQDGEAIQSCTSHFLGQNFGKAFDVQFTTKDNQQEYARATSRGISTRSYGTMIMANGDDKGLVLPPAIAAIHIMIIPIAKDELGLAQVQKYLSDAITTLETMTFEIGGERSLESNNHIITHISPTHQPKPELETKSRNRVCAIVKHPTDNLSMILYTKGTTKLHILFGGGLDEGEDRQDGLRRELWEETGYHDIASIIHLGGEHHWINAGDDGLYNYCSKQRCFVVQLASLDQKSISDHEQSLHDILWILEEEVANTLQDNHSVHHGLVYWNEYVQQQEKRTHQSEKTFFLSPFLVLL